jgi:hypothetical protein
MSETVKPAPCWMCKGLGGIKLFDGGGWVACDLVSSEHPCPVCGLKRRLAEVQIISDDLYYLLADWPKP